MHLCFATPWRTSWKPLCYFFYMLETHTWLSMHYYSWSFVCVNFHVITRLLSFIVKIMSFMPMFRVLWCQHSMLYIVWSRLCWCMSPQKLLFCYHWPTRGRAGVKLGDAWYVSNVSIIFDASCLFMHHLLCVLLHLIAFLCIFWNQSINKMPQCQFPIFYYFCVSEKLHMKYSRYWTKQKSKFLFFLTRFGVQSRDRGGPEGGHTPHGTGHPLAALRHGVGPWSTSWHRPSAYIFSSTRKS
jgi:hypothetical protein